MWKGHLPLINAIADVTVVKMAIIFWTRVIFCVCTENNIINFKFFLGHEGDAVFRRQKSNMASADGGFE